MHNYHITHKAFLACTIIGSTPSILGRLLCPSQHSPLPCTRGIPLHRQSQADKNIMGSMIMSADLIIDTKMVGWYVFQVIIPIRMMQLPREKGAQYMYHPLKHIILIMRNVCLQRLPGDRIHIYHEGCPALRPILGEKSVPLQVMKALLWISSLWSPDNTIFSLEWILLLGEVRVSLIVQSNSTSPHPLISDSFVWCQSLKNHIFPLTFLRPHLLQG